MLFKNFIKLMGKKIKRFFKKIVYRFRTIVLWANFKLGRYKETVWVIGDGRSGTTWVSDIINYDKRFREMFEPFHPDWVNEMSFLEYHQYMRPTIDNEELCEIAHKLFVGNFYHPRIDRTSKKLFYSGLLLKDISTNLFAYHLKRRFTSLKIVFLIRNPFAVAFSKCKKKKWNWMNEPEKFLEQALLYEDYLQPFSSLILEISKSDDYIVKQILIWSIINYVPLKQFSKDELCVVFYENLVLNPNDEISRIFSELNLSSKTHTVNIPQVLLDKPSIVSEKKGVTFAASLNLWRKEASEYQLIKGQEILQQFGFGDLYDSNSIPNPIIIQELMT